MKHLVMPFDPEIIKIRVYAFHRHDIYVNQWYDKNLKLPYSYHLQLVVDTICRYSYILDGNMDDFKKAIIIGYLHDIVEDCRLTFNDLSKLIGVDMARLVMKLVCDPRGETKEDRLNDEYYAGVNEHFLTAFVKLADRIANIEHGLLHSSSMVSTYRKGMDKIYKHFTDPRLKPMIDYIEGILNVVSPSMN